jgi:hypothetical protein
MSRGLLFSPRLPVGMLGPPSLMYGGCRGFFSPWVKRSGDVALYSPASCIEGLLRDGAIKCTSPFVALAWGRY